MTEKHQQQVAEVEVVRYAVGDQGYQDVAAYDAARYQGRANEYKQNVMSNAYRRLIGPLEGKRVLDVGCGTGRGVVAFGKEAALATGCDASPDMLRFAAQKAADGSRCVFAVSHAQRLPFRSDSFDVVTSLNFLHLFSLETQREMVAEMKRVVRPGGWLVLEFDNALNGVVIGPVKRWTGKEHGAMPGEIRHILGQGCRVTHVYGAVLPIVWRIFSYLPGIFIPLERVGYLPGFNRLGHRIYYRLVKEAANGGPS